MDKYGVDEVPQKYPEGEKIARDRLRRGACPVCETSLQVTESVNVLICPKCGSKPFEPSGGR